MGFSLDMPDEAAIKEQVKAELAPLPERKEAIAEVAGKNADAFLTVDLNSFDERKELTTAIETFGADLVKDSATKNELLKTKVGDLGNFGGASADVAKGLEDLTIEMKNLDPSAIDFMKTGPLGKIFNPVRRYFTKFEDSDKAIGDIIKSLDKGETSLRNDNTTLELEQASMRDLTKQLNEKVEMGTQLDEYLTNAIEKAKADGTDPDRVKFVEEEILLPLRQRLLDFEQMLAVNQQGIVAMEIIRRNNLELIRSVERAKTVTVSALRVAVTVASALYHQKIVLEKVNLLNETTNNMIAATSKMLKDQGAEIQKQAIESNISIDTMKQAFADTFAALEDISNYKQEALPRVRQTIDEFKALTEEGEKALQRIEKVY